MKSHTPILITVDKTHQIMLIIQQGFSFQFSFYHGVDFNIVSGYISRDYCISAKNISRKATYQLFFPQFSSVFERYENLNVIINNRLSPMQFWLRLLVLFSIYVIVLSQCTSGNQCTPCNITNCVQCDNDINVCQACPTGSYVDGTGNCATCPTKCLSCSTNTYCDKCTPGYDAEYDNTGSMICVFYWWKWFLIVFGTLLGVVLIGLMFWWVKNKLKSEDGQREVQYEMKGKLENTENTIKE